MTDYEDSKKKLDAVINDTAISYSTGSIVKCIALAALTLCQAIDAQTAQSAKDAMAGRPPKGLRHG